MNTIAALAAASTVVITGWSMTARIRTRCAHRRRIDRVRPRWEPSRDGSARSSGRRRGAAVTAAHGALRRLSHLRAPWRRRPPSPEAVATWCDHLGRRLRSGEALRVALLEADASAPVADCLVPFRHSLRAGSAVADAARLATSSVPAPVATALAVVAAVAETGGAAAAPLDRVGAALRAEAADVAERRAQSAQARISATVMTTMPAAVLLLLAVSDAEVRSAATSAPGAACILVGATLSGIGWWWMRVIIGSAARPGGRR